MCIVAIAWHVLPDQPLILLNNRDEFLNRPTAALATWSDAPIIAGRDLQSGGAWLGINPAGRWAVLTNYREPISKDGPVLSRGQLVADYLQSDQSPMDYARAIDLRAYPAFNLIVGTLDQAVVVSNRGMAPTPLAAGLYVLSNALIDQPWPKVERLRQRVTQEVLPLIGQANPDPSASVQPSDWIHVALDVLADPRQAEEDQLPETGISTEWEKMLSPILIESPIYGTRTSSVLALTRQGYRFVELDRIDLARQVEMTGPWHRQQEVLTPFI